LCGALIPLGRSRHNCRHATCFSYPSTATDIWRGPAESSRRQHCLPDIDIVCLLLSKPACCWKCLCGIREISLICRAGSRNKRRIILGCRIAVLVQPQIALSAGWVWPYTTDYRRDLR
jgi:hypothetical protein